MTTSRNAADQAIVQTPYGRGLVLRSRPDDIRETQLLEWGDDQPSSSPVSRRPNRAPSMLYSSTPFPSVPVRVGDDVTCRFGRGVVKNIDRVKGSKPSLKYTIELKSWRLNGRRSVLCYVNQCDVVRKHTLSEMDVFEKVELAQSQKAKATGYFSKSKDFDKALKTYATAVDAVRNIQHDAASTNEVRSDLVLVMITCSNNAGTCCIKLKKYEEAVKFAQNAEVLIDALYNKRGKKIHTILNKEGTIDAKLFGEWRAKSYMIIARCRICQGRDEEAVGSLKKAKLAVTKYMDGINNTKNGKTSALEKASLKSLTAQAKEIRRLLVECAEKKKANKKLERKRAKAMFAVKKTAGEDKENGRPPTLTSKSIDRKGDPQSKTIEAPLPPEAKGDVLARQRKCSLKPSRPEGPAKSVSFSEMDQVNVYSCPDESDDDQVEGRPWYSEHKEALVLLGIVAGFSASLLAMRRSFRQ